jgi:hypothetical protein
MAGWDITKPGDNDLVRNYPALARTDKTTLQTQLAVEHDLINTGGTSTGRHKFPSGNTAGRPATPPTGAIYVNTQLAVIEQWDGAAWQKRGTLIPVGTKMVFDQDTAPTGWTRDTAQNDRVIRLVSGARADGGSWTISGLAGAAHTHPITTGTIGRGDAGASVLVINSVTSPTGAASSTTVTHTPGWRPLHHDMITATKD